MKVLYLEWNSFGNEDMYEIFGKLGHVVIQLPFSDRPQDQKEVTERMMAKLDKENCDMVYSFNYFPFVSECCKSLGISYVSWVYDSPYLNLYSYTVPNPCNYIFIFDYAQYEELWSNGIRTVYYLPMGVYMDRLDRVVGKTKGQKYISDISFVGSLYTEKKHRLYDKFQSADGFTKGYLDGIIQAQLKVHGYNFLREVLSEEVLAQMQEAYPTNPAGTTVATPRYIYADYVLSRQVTALERQEILKKLGGTGHQISLYTYDKEVAIPGVQNQGPVDYYDHMPNVFANSKINLNITLRSIRTGIPLRAMDIMGSGGFLLSNYQEEFLQYFEPEEDFVYYEDTEDLLKKVEYYLSHDKERMEIAQNGYRKMRENHTMQSRAEEMLRVVVESSGEEC